jgi:hypothetical protein
MMKLLKSSPVGTSGPTEDTVTHSNFLWALAFLSFFLIFFFAESCLVAEWHADHVHALPAQGE